MLFLLLFLLPFSNCYRNTYDFIVVGSGAGGSTVAGRLAENGQFSVLLLESGGDPRPGYVVPGFGPRFILDSGVTFNYKSVPQKNAGLIRGGVVGVPMGKMKGGGTSLNYMWFNRGNPKDWDRWANLTGDSSWKYENMLKYMKRSENYEGDFPSNQHGISGPITVSRPKYAPGLEYWLAAGRELGYPVGDPNGPQVVGFSAVEYSKKHGRRVSSYVGYVEPLLNTKKNLDVLTNTNATEILFSGGRAVAVKIHTESNNPPLELVIFAKKEIIVCAGTYNSPLLLQRSGIGPKDVLQAARIEVVKELPVGTNLQTHLVLGLEFAINDSSAVMDENRDFTPANWEYFLKYGDGPFSQTRGATGQGFFASSVAAAEGNSDWPDYQLCQANGVQPWSPLLSAGSGVQNLLAGEVPMYSYVFVGRPNSHGNIKIKPNDIFGNPILDLGYITDSRDFQVLQDGINKVLLINEETQAYKSLGTRFLPPSIPACQKFPIRSDHYWKCFIMQTMQGGCHAAGTNKMGGRDDPTAVVDTELRVIGVDGLRIVDASIMPFIANANPEAVVYAIGEKAAEMILNRWTKSFSDYRQ